MFMKRAMIAEDNRRVVAVCLLLLLDFDIKGFSMERQSSSRWRGAFTRDGMRNVIRSILIDWVGKQYSVAYKAMLELFGEFFSVLSEVRLFHSNEIVNRLELG